jgi:hypothetical protein
MTSFNVQILYKYGAANKVLTLQYLDMDIGIFYDLRVCLG